MGRPTAEERGLHIVTPEITKKAENFFFYYTDEMTHEQMKERYGGMYGKMPEKPLSRSIVKGIWKRFLEEERRDFIIKHNTISMDDIVRIGIDKFFMTLGWNTPAQVHSWRNNVVRIGICPDCDDQFIPLMFQTNQGLCNNCRPKYSTKAIRRFIEYTITTNDRYEEAHRDALMDFYIMFYSDADLRKLFVKDTPSAKEMEEREFEVPEWYKEEQAKEEARLQQRLTEMVKENE